MLFLVYVALRAWLLPITHDEGSTIINHVPRLVFDSLFYEKEANLNNHILNTLAIKTLLGIFPGSQLVVRLPVFIGCCLYVWAGMEICRRLSANSWIRLFGLVVLLGNPFVADFFALARGYGLAIGLMTMALYQAVRFLENNSPRTLRSAYIFAGLAVYANFTLLLFFMPFSGLLFLTVWQQNRGWAAFLPTVRPAFYTFGIFALLWITPIKRLAKGDDFGHWDNHASNFESIKLFLHSTIHGHPYLGQNTVNILSWAALIFIIVGCVVIIGPWLRNSRQLAASPEVFIAAVFAGTLLADIVQTNVLHSGILNARLTLFFYPFFAFLLFSVADWLWTRWQRRAWIFIGPVLLLLLINNVRCLNLRNSFEWWFDASTFEVLAKIRSIQSGENHPEPYSFDGNWAILNSFTCHVNVFPQGYDHVLQPIQWHDRRAPVAGPDFFFAVDDGEANALGDTYQVVFRPTTGVLLRKK